MVKSLYFSFFALTFLQLQSISCQSNCLIGDLRNDIVNVIELGPFSELTDIKTVLWSAATENIIDASSAPSSHFVYVDGLRYSTKYEYTTSATAIFSTFIAKERSPFIERNVTFSCANEQIKAYFKFNIKDENNSPPEFQQDHFNFELRKSQSGGQDSEVVNIATKIIIRDLDWDEEHAKVKVMTTHDHFSATVTRDLSVPIETALEFNVELRINWEVASLGMYSFEILANDGRFSRSTSVNVNVLL